jgi:hypothetical protein
MTHGKKLYITDNENHLAHVLFEGPYFILLTDFFHTQYTVHMYFIQDHFLI